MSKRSVSKAAVTSEELIGFRNSLKLTQEQFADTFDVPLGTVRNWEQRKSPLISASRLALFNIIVARKGTIVD